MFRIILSLLFLSVVLSSCNFFKTHEIFIDNPTEYELTIDINNKTHVIEPYGNKTVKLKAKSYEVVATIQNQEILLHDHLDDEHDHDHEHEEAQNFIIYEGTLSVSQSGIFNPTLYTYVVWKDLYLEDMNKYNDYASSQLNLKPQLTINDKNYNDVDFTIFKEQLFIPKTWDYGLAEPWSDNVDVFSKSFVVKSKIYRLDALEEEWGYWGEFDMSDYTDEDFKNLIDSLEAKAKLKAE